MHDSSRREPTLIGETGFAYFPLALIARFPFAMMVVGVLTLVVAARGSVELGGLASALVGLGSATIGPLVGAAADRYGQRPTLLLTAASNSALLGLLAWTAYSPLPMWAVFAVAFLVGASGPQTSPMSRSRLVMIIRTALPPARQPKTLSSTLAYESAADEIVFVFGPVVVGVLATAFGAWAPIAGAAAMTLVFVTAFALHRTSLPVQSTAERAETLAPASELWRPKLTVAVLGVFAVGLLFGSTLTSLTAFMQDQGEAERAGLFYGVMGVGSAILALCVARFSPRFTLRYRWLSFALTLVVGVFVFAGGHGFVSIVTGLAVTGLGVGPLLVTLYSFGAARSPEGRSATVMTMLGSGIILGQSTAAAVTGFVAENIGTETALALPIGAALLAFAAGAVNWALTGDEREPRARTAPIPLP